MQAKSKPAAKDLSVVPLPWLDPAWMEKADLFGDRYAQQFARAQREALDQAEVLVEDQLVFLRERVHADFECAKALSEIRDPVEAARVLSDFWQRMVSDYSDCLEKSGAKIRDIAARAYATSLELAETSGEAAAEAVDDAAEAAVKPSAA